MTDWLPLLAVAALPWLVCRAIRWRGRRRRRNVRPFVREWNATRFQVEREGIFKSIEAAGHRYRPGSAQYAAAVGPLLDQLRTLDEWATRELGVSA